VEDDIYRTIDFLRGFPALHSKYPKVGKQRWMDVYVKLEEEEKTKKRKLRNLASNLCASQPSWVFYFLHASIQGSQ